MVASSENMTLLPLLTIIALLVRVPLPFMFISINVASEVIVSEPDDEANDEKVIVLKLSGLEYIVTSLESVNDSVMVMSLVIMMLSPFASATRFLLVAGRNFSLLSRRVKSFDELMLNVLADAANAIMAVAKENMNLFNFIVHLPAR
jgi:hypothetical protein